MSDIFDGFLARKLGQESVIGARLDSVADFVFATTLSIVVIKNIHLPMYLWWCIVAIAFMRLTSCGIGFYKYRTFSLLHTLMNKTAGASIFAFPLFYICFGLDTAGIMICIVAFLSSVEEMAIIIKSKELNCDIY